MGAARHVAASAVAKKGKDLVVNRNQKLPSTLGKTVGIANGTRTSYVIEPNSAILSKNSKIRE